MMQYSLSIGGLANRARDCLSGNGIVCLSIHFFELMLEPRGPR
jgi:hypothetical protein